LCPARLNATLAAKPNGKNTMEELKRFTEIQEPDERQKAIAVINHVSGQYRPRTLRDIYDGAASMKLHSGVPEKIRSHFATAQNLLVYSWFFYPFNVTSQFLAFVTVEFALKEILKPKKYLSFKQLLSQAVAQGLVKDEGFSHLREQQEIDEQMFQETGMEQETVKSYVETLIETMPYLRNELAHGSQMLHPNGASSVRICAEFINQLFLRNGS
jgi:hypothetical protein